VRSQEPSFRKQDGCTFQACEENARIHCQSDIVVPIVHVFFFLPGKSIRVLRCLFAYWKVSGPPGCIYGRQVSLLFLHENGQSASVLSNQRFFSPRQQSTSAEHLCPNHPWLHHFDINKCCRHSPQNTMDGEIARSFHQSIFSTQNNSPATFYKKAVLSPAAAISDLLRLKMSKWWPTECHVAARYHGGWQQIWQRCLVPIRAMQIETICCTTHRLPLSSRVEQSYTICKKRIEEELRSSEEGKQTVVRPNVEGGEFAHLQKPKLPGMFALRVETNSA